MGKFKLGTVISLGGLVVVAPMIAAYGGPSYDEWATTDGAAGRINLDDVQQAFKDSKSATDFEERVNQIYEGDGLVLVRARQNGSLLTLEGWEDLNNSSGIGDEADDLLFSIVKGTNDEYDMQGYHANGYYHSHFGAGDFLFAYMLTSAISPRGYYYSTPVSQGPAMRNVRTTYRQSESYSQQVQRNTYYNATQPTLRGSQYEQSRSNVSSNRTSYQQTQKTGGAFKTSNSVSRRVSGSYHCSDDGGGGGAMVVLGRRRS